MSKKFKPEFVMVENKKFFLDENDAHNLTVFGSRYKKYYIDCMLKEVKKGDIALSLGANIGYFTIFLAEAIGKNGKVFAVEPEKENIELLQKNIDANNLKNVKVIPKAISDKNEKVKFKIVDENSCSTAPSGEHTIVIDEVGENILEIDAIGIDQYFKEISSSINFIIITIEGAELKALKGMTNTIKQAKKLTIMTEFFPEKIRSLGDSPEEFIKLLTNFGFEFFDLDDGLIPIHKTDSKTIISNMNKDKFYRTDLLCKLN